MTGSRDGQLLQKYISEKKAEIESSHDPEVTYELVCELEALEWLYRASQNPAPSSQNPGAKNQQYGK